MRHEVVNLVLDLVGVGVGVNGRQQRASSLDAHAPVERAPLAPVFNPTPKLRKA